jgi:polysaccharide export outer membrane protein
VRQFLVLLYALLAFVLSGCGSKNILADSSVIQHKESVHLPRQAKRNYSNGRFEYRIQPHDRLAVGVYKHPELSGKGLLVDSRGNIILPLINTVHVGGLSQPQASQKLRRLFGRYLKHASVQVESLNKRAYVVGEVGSPGAIPLPNEQTALLQAIATRGGFRDTANRTKIIVMRNVGRGSRADVVDLTNLTSLSYAGMMIRPGDIVYVPPTSMKNFEVNIGRIFQIASYVLTPFAYYKTLTK